MQRFKKILVQVDSSRAIQPALDQGVALAERNQAVLTIVDVVPEFSWPARLALEEAEKVRSLLADQKRRRLGEIAEPLSGRGLDVHTKVLMGRSSVQTILEVERDGYDLVIRETKGVHSRRAGFLGTTALQLLRRCPCAVWLIKPEQGAAFSRILAAVDAAAHDEAHRRLNATILDMATGLAQSHSAALDVAYAWSIYGENVLREHMRPEEFADLERHLVADSQRSLDKLLARHGLSVRSDNVHLLRGDASSEIPRFATEAHVDLLVMGTVARTGIAGWFIGNTAERIFDKVSCSLLAVKPEGFSKSK